MIDETTTGSGWREALSELERILTEGDSTEALRSVADPDFLGLLLRLELDTLVRRGPVPKGPTPRTLLSLAQQAAIGGAVPLQAAAVLHRHLPRLEALVKKCGAWEPETPLWWGEPPTPSPLQHLWQRFDDGTLVEVPDKAILESALTGGARWLSLPRLLHPEFTSPLWKELEEAHGAGQLDLERGDVGTGQVSAQRSDEVLYFSGLEPGLLAVAPHLAVLIQWSLDRWGRRLLGVGEQPAFPPARAMLARYPAPSGGYAAHMDNPGGDRDNGRLLTLVMYLNGPSYECRGGEISLWPEGLRTTAPPALVLPPTSGSAVIFDARRVAHRVEPLAPGHPRWALTLWFNGEPQRPPSFPVPRLPSLSDILRPVEAPPLPPKTLLFHTLDDQRPSGEITVHRLPRGRLRSGVVATVYRGGADLEAWCHHHFEHGVDHAILVFDHLEEPEETATARELRRTFSKQQLTVLSGREVAEGWDSLPEDPRLDPVRRLAHFGGASSYAVASRQALNAGVVLRAIQEGEVAGSLDWLVHLDADEYLLPLGRGRGGGDLGEHFAAASAAGLERLRYVNHELLPPKRSDERPRFKLNPRLAVARLGQNGWQSLVEHLRLEQTSPRPWFHGYFNGKSAVAVPAGHLAAGVHSWFLKEPRPDVSQLLAGPVVLHFHYSTAQTFRRKYLRAAAAGIPPGPLPFEPCATEERALQLVRTLRRQGASEAELEQQLETLHRTLTTFSERDLELLEEAGLIFDPESLLRWPAHGMR